jgi:hypothetical protein
MKIYYYLMMKYYDHFCQSGAFSLEDQIYHGNQYMKYRRLYEKR